MAIIRQRASSRIKRFYSNAMRSHITLSREAVLAIMRKMRAEMLALDDGIPDGCHIVNPPTYPFGTTTAGSTFPPPTPGGTTPLHTPASKPSSTTRSTRRIWQTRRRGLCDRSVISNNNESRRQWLQKCCQHSVLRIPGGDRI